MTDLILPKLNQTGSNEWADPEDNDVAIRTFLNTTGVHVYQAGTVTDTALASPNNSAYKTLLTGTGQYPASTSGTRYFDNSEITQNAASVSAGLVLIYFDDADFTVASKTQKLRVRAQQATIGTGPGTTLTVGMYPVTAVSAGTFTVGAVVSGSTIAFASTGADTLTQNNSGDFTIPSDGYYIFGVANSGTTAASSAHDLYFQLQTRNV